MCVTQLREAPSRPTSATTPFLTLSYVDLYPPAVHKCSAVQRKARENQTDRTKKATGPEIVCLLVGCLTSQQQASVSQGRICSDNFTCCHTEIKVADPTFYLTQSQYTDTGPTSPSADPITPDAWQGSHWSANF